eukprot:11163220-Lingulodinium_polyedra.AAC.1
MLVFTARARIALKAGSHGPEPDWLGRLRPEVDLDRGVSRDAKVPTQLGGDHPFPRAPIGQRA